MDDLDKQRQERIERYLDGKLTAEEMSVFETQLQTDEELAKAFSLEETARLIIATAGREELRNRLDTYESAFEKKTSSVKVLKPKNRQWFPLAAVLLALIAVSLWLFIPGGETSNDLFAAHFDIYRSPSTVRGKESKDVWQEATEAYTSSDYAKAAMLFQKSLDDPNTIPYLAEFYRGISLLAEVPPQAQTALAAFEKVLQSDNDYQQQAMWYQALALLHLQRNGEAKKALTDLQNTGSYKDTQVKELLEELSSVE